MKICDVGEIVGRLTLEFVTPALSIGSLSLHDTEPKLCTWLACPRSKDNFES
jgi:hypothetical protein